MSPMLNPAANGIYCSPAEPGFQSELGQAAGTGCFDIDLRRLRGKRGLLSALARALRFPETYGVNWDALADCLQDLCWLPPEQTGVVLHLRGYHLFKSRVPQDAATLEAILAETAQFWQARSRLFVVFTEGAGAPWPRAS